MNTTRKTHEIANDGGPLPGELVDWSIRLNPELARERPADAIKQVVDLYLCAAKAQYEWGRHWREFKDNEEKRRLEQLLVASVDPKLDTFCRWLGAHKKNAKDVLQPSENLLEVIFDLCAVGVAEGKDDNGEWMIEKLETGDTDEGFNHDGEYNEPSMVYLTEWQAKQFLRLRTVFREKRGLQDEYRAWLKVKERQEKIASAKAKKNAGK